MFVHDAGIGHILAASSIPLVTLFGPTPAEKFIPNGKNITVLSAKQYGGEAMYNIPVKDVLQALTSIFKVFILAVV